MFRLKYFIQDLLWKIEDYSFAQCARCNTWHFSKDLSVKRTTMGTPALLCETCMRELYPDEFAEE